MPRSSATVLLVRRLLDRLAKRSSDRREVRRRSFSSRATALRVRRWRLLLHESGSAGRLLARGRRPSAPASRPSFRRKSVIFALFPQAVAAFNRSAGKLDPASDVDTLGAAGGRPIPRPALPLPPTLCAISHDSVGLTILTNGRVARRASFPSLANRAKDANWLVPSNPSPRLSERGRSLAGNGRCQSRAA